MIHTTEMYRLLAHAQSVIRGSDAVRESDNMAAWTDQAALRMLDTLVDRMLDLMAREPLGGAPVAATEQHQSSVEIESRVKGEPGIKVKAYTGSDLEDPAARAVEMYRRLKAQLAEEATVGGLSGCQDCGEPHGVAVPCGFRRGVPS